MVSNLASDTISNHGIYPWVLPGSPLPSKTISNVLPITVGLRVTGVPEHTLSAQVAYIVLFNRYYSEYRGISQSNLPLNDANTAFPPKYQLLNAFAQWDINKRFHLSLSGETC